uniref:Chromo domain-containing protein n=1 Tax=Panagrolaimus davidi TaxID=227884 RepID=A0A914QTF2_9BILA
MDKLYADLNFPASYAGINALQRELKGKPEKKELEDFKLRNRTYQLYRSRYYKFKRLKTMCTSWMTDFQADLADFQKLSRQNKVCRTTGLKPNDINEKNAQQVWEKVYGHPEEPAAPKFKVGDHVRIALKKSVFDRGYLNNYTDEIFQIVTVQRTNPPTYVVRHENGDIVKGKIYEKQLIKTIKNTETTYRVERVIRQKRQDGKKHYYVKFMGFPNPQWITEDDFV